MHNTFSSLPSAIIIFTLALTIGIYLFFKWKFQYWSKRGIPCLPPVVPIGNIADTFLGRKSVSEVFQDLHLNLKKAGNKYGGAYVMGTPVLVAVDPDLIKTILTREFSRFQNRSLLSQEDGSAIEGNLFGAKGMKWRKLRSKLSTLFTPVKAKMMFETILFNGEQLNQTVSKIVETNKPIEMRDIAMRFMMDIVGSVLFGVGCNTLKYPDSEIMKYGKLLFSNSLVENMRILFHVAAPNFLKFFKIPPVNAKGLNYLAELFNKTFDYRMKNNINRQDFIDHLIKLKNSENNDWDFELTPELLTSQCLAFFFAGYDSSSNTIAFCIYELAVNSKVQEKLREEIIMTLKKYDNKFTYEAIMEMSYMDKVVKETLRKYPSIPVLNRVSMEDFHCPNTGLSIEKDTPIMISLLGLHYDPENYPNPMKFDPERFNEENILTRHPYTYLPFGEGPRYCIGMRFGAIQSKLGIAILIKNFKFTCNDKTAIPMIFDPAIPLLASKNQIWLNVEHVNC